jgi:hypothetical protein
MRNALSTLLVLVAISLAADAGAQTPQPTVTEAPAAPQQAPANPQPTPSGRCLCAFFWRVLSQHERTLLSGINARTLVALSRVFS